MQNIENILNQNGTKTAKIKMLLELGMTRKQVAEAIGVGYGFVQNVYAANFGTTNPRGFNCENFNFNRTFGVEIEIVHNSKAKVRDAIKNAGVVCEIEGYNHSRRNHWKIVTDASVSGGFEVVSPVLKGQDGLDQLEKVCQALQSVNAKVNKSTGLHVHLGTNDFGNDINVWKNLYKNYVKLESIIDSFMPESRRNNSYCKSLKVANWNSKIDSATNLEDLESKITNRSRYFKLNSQSYWRHKTVEFRQHSGTVEFEKISNWVLFCARFVEYSKKNVVASENKSELKKFLNSTLESFYQARALKFAA